MGILFAGLASFSAAADGEFEIRIGAAKSDNIARTDMFAIEETIALAGLNLDLQYESRKVWASLITDLEYRDYTNDTFDNEVVGSLDADVELQFAPEVFSWIIRDQFGNLVTNPFQANTPINRQYVNRFSTGPDLRLRFGSSTAIELGGRYHSNRFEISDIDSEERYARISLVRAMSPHRSISLNVTGSRIEFDNTVLNSNYDRRAAYLGFQSDAARGSLTLNLGINELDDDGEVVDGNLINVSWDREISPSTTFTLAFREGLTDAAGRLGQQDP